jgi:hypothetical protein
MTVHRQQTRHQDLTILRANEHFHDCSGGHFKIFPLYEVNTEGDFIRRRKDMVQKRKNNTNTYVLDTTICTQAQIPQISPLTNNWGKRERNFIFMLKS